MTISNQNSKISYTGNGVTTDFAVPFYFINDTDIQVYSLIGETESLLTLNVDYSLTGAGNHNGGTLTMFIAPSSNVKITVLRVVPMTQEVDYLENEIFPAQTHEMALDKLTMEVQQNAEKLSRSLTLSVTSDENPNEIIPQIFDARRDAVQAAELAEQSKNDILNNAGFQAVAADLTGPNKIGAVADDIENVNEVVENMDAIKAAPEAAEQAASQADRSKTEADRAESEADRAQQATDGKANVNFSDVDNTDNVAANNLNTKGIRTVVEAYRNGANFYRIWSDGFKEQGGYVVNSNTNDGYIVFNMLILFSDTNFKFIRSGKWNNTTAGNSNAYGSGYLSKTVSSVNTRTNGNPAVVGYDWYACGY